MRAATHLLSYSISQKLGLVSKHQGIQLCFPIPPPCFLVIQLSWIIELLSSTAWIDATEEGKKNPNQNKCCHHSCNSVGKWSLFSGSCLLSIIFYFYIKRSLKKKKNPKINNPKSRNHPWLGKRTETGICFLDWDGFLSTFSLEARHIAIYTEATLYFAYNFISRFQVSNESTARIRWNVKCAWKEKGRHSLGDNFLLQCQKACLHSSLDLAHNFLSC